MVVHGEAARERRALLYGLLMETDDAQLKRPAPPSNSVAPEPKKRIVLGAPTPLPAAPADAASVPAGKQDNGDSAMSDGVPRASGDGPEDEDDDSDSAESFAADDDASRQEALKRLSDEEKQELVDRVMEAMGEADHYADMMEGGPLERPLGQPHPGVTAQRLEVERESLEEMRNEMNDEYIDFSAEELAHELAERWAPWGPNLRILLMTLSHGRFSRVERTARTPAPSYALAEPRCRQVGWQVGGVA